MLTVKNGQTKKVNQPNGQGLFTDYIETPSNAFPKVNIPTENRELSPTGYM
jgi:hypothetical protein